MKGNRMSALIITILGYVASAAGLFLGFYYYFEQDYPTAIRFVTMIAVGVVGLLAFIRHVIFHKSDAKRLGMETANPDWQFEVGFANLAVGAAALIVNLANWGNGANPAIILIFAIYLLCVAIFHICRSFGKGKVNVVRLLRGGVISLVFSLMLFFFVSITF